VNEFVSIAPSVRLGQDVRLSKFINLYGCEIGDETKIGAFVEIQKNASVGKRCKISSHTFICDGVTIEDCVAMARHVGEQIWKRYQIPVYLYEEASANPLRTNLEDIRRGEFEGLAAKMAAPGWAP